MNLLYFHFVHNTIYIALNYSKQWTKELNIKADSHEKRIQIFLRSKGSSHWRVINRGPMPSYFVRTRNSGSDISYERGLKTLYSISSRIRSSTYNNITGLRVGIYEDVFRSDYTEFWVQRNGKLRPYPEMWHKNDVTNLPWNRFRIQHQNRIKWNVDLGKWEFILFTINSIYIYFGNYEIF